MTEKQCKVCGNIKPLCDFYFNKRDQCYFGKCKPCAYLRSRRYIEGNRVIANKRIKEWRMRNPHKFKAIAARSREKNKLNRSRGTKQWRLENRERTRFHQKKWKHLRRSSTSNPITFEQWQRLLLIYNLSCVYCHKKVKTLTQDRVIPLSRGGTHTADNIVPACQSCNSKKCDREAPSFQPVLIGVV